MHAKNIEKRTREEREQALKMFVEGEVQFGPLFQSAVVLKYATEVSVEELPTVLCPTPSDVAWDPLRPVLGSCKFPPVEKARVMLKAFVHDRLLKVVAKGAEGVPELQALLAAMRPFKPATAADDVVVEACKQLQDIIRYFDVLFGCSKGEDCQAALDAVVQSTGRGAVPLLRKAVGNSPHFKGLEQHVRQSLLALKTLLPDVQQACQELQGKSECKAWSEVVTKLPTWRDGLPETTMAPLLQMLRAFVKGTWAECLEMTEVGPRLIEFIDFMRVLRVSLPQDKEYEEINQTALELQKQLLADASSSKLRACLLTWLADLGMCPFLLLFSHKERGKDSSHLRLSNHVTIGQPMGLAHVQPGLSAPIRPSDSS